MDLNLYRRFQKWLNILDEMIKKIIIVIVFLITGCLLHAQDTIPREKIELDTIPKEQLGLDTLSIEKTKLDTSFFQPDDDDWNLILAAEWGIIPAVELLLKRGADPNAHTWDNVTPLMIAAEQGFYNISKMLISYGADMNAEPTVGVSALLGATMYDRLDVVELLIQNYANINITDSKGVTALMYASAYNYYVMADMLVFYGADVNTQDNDGNTALMVATHAGNKDIVDVLLVNGAEVDLADEKGNTPLIVASEHGYNDIVQTFIEFNADIEHKNEAGMTPLVVATANGHEKIVEKLLYYGVNPNTSKKISENPMAIAKKHKYYSIANKLKEAGAKPVRYKPEFTSIPICFDMDWNTTDFMYGGNAGIVEGNMKLALSMGYHTRAGYKRVLIDRGENSYYQLFEKRSLAYIELQKMMSMKEKPNGGHLGVVIGLKGLYSYGKYRGFTPRPDGLFTIAPRIGYYTMGKHAAMSLNYEYMNFDVFKVSPHRINISFAILINLKKSAGSEFEIDWLD